MTYLRVSKFSIILMTQMELCYTVQQTSNDVNAPMHLRHQSLHLMPIALVSKLVLCTQHYSQNLEFTIRTYIK